MLHFALDSSPTKSFKLYIIKNILEDSSTLATCKVAHSLNLDFALLRVKLEILRTGYFACNKFYCIISDGTRLKCPDPDQLLAPTRISHLWYQWVPFYFWLAAAAFFMPYLLYKNFGMGDIKPLVR